MKQLARISGDILSSGVFQDDDSQAAPLFVDAANVYFSSKKIQPFPGGKAKFLTGIAAPILGIEAARIAGQPTIFYGTASTLYSWDEVTGIQVLVTGYSGLPDATSTTPASLWRIVPWNQWVIATNGKDPPQIWKGGSFAPLAGISSVFSTATEFVKWKQYLIAIGLDTAENDVAWSDTGNPEVWAPTATNDAGSLKVIDTEAELRAARLLNNSVVLYGHNSMHALNFLRSREVFGVQRLLTGIGAFSKFAVTSLRGQHYGFGPRGIWRTDGVSYDYIHTPAVRQTLLSSVNEDQASKVLAYHDARAEAIVFFYPSGSSKINNAGYAYNYRDRSWSPIVLDRSTATNNGIFPFPLTGSAAGLIFDQSLFNSVATPSVDSSIALPATYSVSVGFGSSGFGAGGFGGLQNGSG